MGNTQGIKTKTRARTTLNIPCFTTIPITMRQSTVEHKKVAEQRNIMFWQASMVLNPGKCSEYTWGICTHACLHNTHTHTHNCAGKNHCFSCCCCWCCCCCFSWGFPPTFHLLKPQNQKYEAFTTTIKHVWRASSLSLSFAHLVEGSGHGSVVARHGGYTRD